MAEAGVFVLGSGGREEALRQAMEVSPEVGRVVVNADVADGLEQFSGGPKPFVVVGPEAPLVAGIADDLRAEGYTVFGVGCAGASYEKNKSHAAQLLSRYGISHPKTFVSEVLGDDLAYLRDRPFDTVVIKADELAYGRGVVLPGSAEEAEATVRGMRSGKLFGGAGKKAIIFQERYRGPEVSVMTVVGRHGRAFNLPYSQDHKPLCDGDTGPNTGGMGGLCTSSGTHCKFLPERLD